MCAVERVREDYTDHVECTGDAAPSKRANENPSKCCNWQRLHPLQSSECCNLQQTSANPKKSELACCDLQYLQALKNSKCCHLQYLQALRKLNAIVTELQVLDELPMLSFKIGSLCARQDAVDCSTRTETMQEDQRVQKRRQLRGWRTRPPQSM